MSEKVFLDSNIVIDFLLDRSPFSESATRLFDLCVENKIQLFISAGSFDTLYYILRKNAIRHPDCIFLLKKLHKMVGTVEVDHRVVANSLESEMGDLEDAIQYFCARKVKGIRAIVSRNFKGFNRGSIPIVTAEEYLKSLN